MREVCGKKMALSNSCGTHLGKRKGNMAKKPKSAVPARNKVPRTGCSKKPGSREDLSSSLRVGGEKGRDCGAYYLPVSREFKSPWRRAEGEQVRSLSKEKSEDHS